MPRAPLRLDLAFLLPDEAHECPRCVDALIAIVAARPEISAVARQEEAGRTWLVVAAKEQGGEADIEQAIAAAAADLVRRVGHFSLPVGGGAHAQAAVHLAALLRGALGVIAAEVLSNGHSRVEYDRRLTNESDLLAVLRSSGVDFVPDEAGVAPSAAPPEIER
jgi:hypothetical protein